MIALRDQLQVSPRPPQNRKRETHQSIAPSGSRGEAQAPAPASDALQTSLVSTRSDLHAALRLVYDAYRETNLIAPNAWELRATAYHLVPTTHVFIARLAHEIVGTLTLIRDGEQGMPMEQQFQHEIAVRRERGISVAEVSCLADKGHGKTSMLAVVVQLMSHMAQFAFQQDVEELLIAVHPHHAGFYQRFIGFEVIGDEKPYTAVCDKPAVPLALNLRTMPINHPRAHERFFGKPFSEELLAIPPQDQGVLEELAAIVDAIETAPTNTQPR